MVPARVSDFVDLPKANAQRGGRPLIAAGGSIRIAAFGSLQEPFIFREADSYLRGARFGEDLCLLPHSTSPRHCTMGPYNMHHFKKA